MAMASRKVNYIHMICGRNNANDWRKGDNVQVAN